jgi:hypothetical protein
MKYEKCKSCGQWIRNTKGKQKKEIIKELCDLMGWDRETWAWKIQNTSMNYDQLVDIVEKIRRK